MLRRVSRGLGHTAKQAQKVHLKLDVEKLDNLPAAVKNCRVVWSRGPKVQMTNIKDVAKGAVVFKQQLSQIATMYRDAKGGFEPKEYKFQVQVPAKGDETKLITVGKADLDLSFFVLSLGQPQSKLVPIMFKVGPASTGYLKLLITAEAVAGDIDEDGMTEVSGMTGVAHMNEEQDLSGFNEEAEDGDTFSFKPQSKAAPAAGSSAARKNSRFANSPTAAAAAAADEPKPWEAKGPGPGSRRDSEASSKALAAAAAATDGGGSDDDGEISPMSLSPTASGELPAETAQPGSRGPGKPSVVAAKGTRAAASSSGGAAAAAKDARSQLFGNSGSPATGTKGVPGRSGSEKSIQDLSEDEARSELFSSGARSSKAASAAGAAATQRRKIPASSSSNSGNSSKAAGISSPAPAAAPVKPPTGTAAAPMTRSSSTSSSNAGTSVASGAASFSAAAGGGRRGLLDRSKIKEMQQQPAEPLASSSTAAGSSKAEPSRTSSLNKHSLSDSDDEDGPSAAAGYSGQVLKAPASRQVGSAAQAAVQLPTSAKQAAAGGSRGSSGRGSPDSAASRQLVAENEKLRAQMVALREQAAAAEDARRQARLAAENAAAERDEYREQAAELQQQLKEAIVGTVSAEEAEDLQQQILQLQQQLQQQQQQQAVHQVPGGADQWQQERALLLQQLADSQHRADNLQLQLEELHENDVQQVQQLQQQLDEAKVQQQEEQNMLMAQVAKIEQQVAAAAAIAEEAELHKTQLAAQVAELTQELQATQELLRLQQEAAAQLAEAAKPRSSSGDVPALSGLIVELRAAAAAAEEKAAAAEKQRDGILAVLLKEVQVASQLEGMPQHMADAQVVEATQLCTATLVDDPTVQEALVKIVVPVKAAVAAVPAHSATEARLADELATMKAVVDEVQAARKAEREQHEQQQHQHQQQPGLDKLLQQMAQLQATVSQLQQDKQMLLQQQQQQQQQQGGTVEGQDDLVKAKQQLHSSRRKVQQLTQARDKLEIILHDFEASAAEERQQLETQLAAANQAARKATNQLADVTEQLKQAQQQLAEALEQQQQQVDSLQQQLQEQQRQQQAEAQPLMDEAADSITHVAPADCTGRAAAAGTAMQALELADSAGPSGMQEALAAAQAQLAELQKQLAEGEVVRRGLDAELARLRRQLAEEQSERGALEEQLAQHLEESEDFMAQDAVAAFEAKYNRLKTRYRELTEAHRVEVDGLHDEIAGLQERLVDLEAAAAQLEAARSQAQHGEATLAETLAKSSKASSELVALRAENQSLMQELVSTKLELAQCSEREVVGRRELYKAKETNMKLASKMTRLEVQMYKK